MVVHFCSAEFSKQSSQKLTVLVGGGPGGKAPPHRHAQLLLCASCARRELEGGWFGVGGELDRERKTEYIERQRQKERERKKREREKRDMM